MSINLTKNLISYYKLDEVSGNAIDVVGGYTLTNTGTMTYGAAKIRNGAVTATGKYLSGNSIDPDSYNSGLSISFWYKFVPASTAYDFVGWGQAGSWGGVSVYYEVTSGKIWFRFGIGSNNDHNSGIAAANGVWTHVVITHAGSGANKDIIYINGVAASFTGGTLANSNATFSIGLNIVAGTVVLAGSVDEVGIWGRVLTATEVKELYSNGGANQYPFASGKMVNFM